MASDTDDERLYKVVINDEEQYSIWFAERDNAPGWRDVGKSGTKAECLAYIKEVWTDMRPLSLRRKMEEAARNPQPPEPAAASPERHPLGKDDLVARLEEPQPIEAGLRPERSARALKDQIERGHVFVKFVRTGTELGIRLDREACDLSEADFDAGAGTAKIVGELVLNYNHVRCHCQIDLSTLGGTGRLEFVREIRLGEG